MTISTCTRHGYLNFNGYISANVLHFWRRFHVGFCVGYTDFFGFQYEVMFTQKQVLESLTQLEDEQQELQLAGAGAGAILPGRRHSSTEGGTTTTTADPELKVTVARRHSLPSDGSGLSNGCVIEIHGRDVSPESTEVSGIGYSIS